MVKNTNLKIKEPKHDYEINQRFDNRHTNQEMIELIERAKNLLKEMPDIGISRGDKALFSKDMKFVTPNLTEQCTMLEWAGICFGEDHAFLLQKSIKRLALLSGATHLQFFGKIYGTCKDYWVV